MGVPERHVPPLAGLDAQRDAHEAERGAHRVIVVGDDVEAEPARRAHRLDNLGEALRRGDQLVVAATRDGALGLLGAVRRVGHVGVLRQAAHERAELELLEQLQHGRAVVVVHL